MKKEHDDYLCKTYPKMFKERYADMSETCMCWGFDCGDGWFHILDKLCSNIQSYINFSRANKARIIRFNRALRKAIAGDRKPLLRFYSAEETPNQWALQQVDADVKNATYREVPDTVSQVVVEQVKEKFGTLRFYTRGGDAYTNGMIQMAESMTEVTCEICGAPGDTGGNNWIRTLCAMHRLSTTEHQF